MRPDTRKLHHREPWGVNPVPRFRRPARRRASRSGRAFAAVVAVLSLGAAAGCAADQSLPRVDFPSASPVPSIGTVFQVSPAPSFTGYAPPLNALQVTVSGLNSGQVMKYPMDPVTFTVKITNTSSVPFHDIQALIVMGQCTCNPKGYGLPPHTSLQYWNTQTKAWTNISVSEMGTGLTFRFDNQAGPLDLAGNASASYTYRVSLARMTKETGLVDGTGSLAVYMLQLPRHTRLKVGLDPDASVSLTYTFQ
jgi:hypothetical protein